MTNKDIEEFSYSALIVLIRDILEFDIIIPRLIFDYSYDPKISTGYYMYQNPAGTIITLNMNCINDLRVIDDIKTVIVYGFIHEIMHMYQNMNSCYFTDKNFYTTIEDTADYYTIEIVRQNKTIIENRLHFKINDVFLHGIERQLKYIESLKFNNLYYIGKTLVGAISKKMNMNFDYLFSIIKDNNPRSICVIFPDKRKFYIDAEYAQAQELDNLINLIYLTDFVMVRPVINDSTIEFYLC